jgi:aminodeoxyfutalosine deaminase
MESIQEKELYISKKGLLFNALSQIYNHYSPNIDISDLSKYINKFSDKSKRKILVHNVEIDNSDDYNSENTFFCLCPRSNIKIHNKLPREEFVYSNYNFVVGTDSLASNDSLCVLSELKCLMNSFPKLTLEKVLKWATFNGACAISKEDSLGWFSKGMAPGIILLENLDLQNLKLNKNTKIKRLT